MRLWRFSPLILLSLSGCVNAGSVSEFSLVSVSGSPNCKVIYDQGQPLLRQRRAGGSTIYALGKCPKKLPGEDDVFLSERQSIVFSDGIVRMTGKPGKDGVATKTIIRPNNGRFKQRGKYVYLNSKIYP